VAESTDKFFFFLGQKTFPKYLSWYISARWKLRAGAGKDVLHEAATDFLYKWPVINVTFFQFF
jgi:hypothetical protein